MLGRRFLASSYTSWVKSYNDSTARGIIASNYQKDSLLTHKLSKCTVAFHVVVLCLNLLGNACYHRGWESVV